MPYVLETCLHEIYTDTGWDLASGLNSRLGAADYAATAQWPIFPTLDDLYHKFDEVVDQLGYEDRIAMDVKAGLKARVGSLMLGSKGLMLKAGTVVDATLISAPSSTKNATGERDPEMHQSKKGNQWFFGMKAHIGVDAESGLVHTVRSTAGHVNDVIEANSLLHGDESDAFGDAGYQGVAKRPDAKPDVTWHVAMRPGRRKSLDLSSPLAALIDKSQQILAGIRAKVEHPFRVIKRQFGFTKVRYRGLKKNAAQVQTLFALSNLWMARRKLMASAA